MFTFLLNQLVGEDSAVKKQNNICVPSIFPYLDMQHKGVIDFSSSQVVMSMRSAANVAGCPLLWLLLAAVCSVDLSGFLLLCYSPCDLWWMTWWRCPA